MQPFDRSASSKAFNYVDRHRERGATELRTKLKPFRRRKLLGKAMKPNEEIIGTLPGDKGMMR